MSSGIKVRVGVNVSGKIVELFKFEDRGSRGILLNQDFLEKHDNGDGTWTTITEQHFSVHPSTRGDNTLITLTTDLADGKTISRASFIPGPSNRLIWPIYSGRSPGSQVHPSKEETNASSVIQIASFDERLSTLFYTVFVTTKYLNLRKIPLKATRLHYFTLDIYRIVVLLSFVPIPTFPIGDLTSITTSSKVINRTKSKDHIQVDVTSLNISDMQQRHGQFIYRLRNKMIDRIRKTLKLSPESIAVCEELSTFFLSEPDIIKTMEAMERVGDELGLQRLTDSLARLDKLERAAFASDA